jgi:DNA-binding NarL/FixJ family response regulator
VVLKGLVQLCAEEEDLEVVAQCENGEVAMQSIARLRPDVVVLDLRMPIKDGLQVLVEMKQKGLQSAVVLLTGNISDREVIEAVRLGARGIVLKEMAPSLLLQCIRKVHAGELWLEKESVSRALDKMVRQDEDVQRMKDALTPRELEVLRRVVQGLQNQEIAAQLFISEGTVKTHLHAIYEKLGVRGRVQLILLAKEQGLD